MLFGFSLSLYLLQYWHFASFYVQILFLFFFITLQILKSLNSLFLRTEVIEIDPFMHPTGWKERLFYFSLLNSSALSLVNMDELSLH